MRNTALLFTSAALFASPVPAQAISWSTQINCATDYYAYCSMHVAGSAGCHACMRTNRPKLSSACVSALVDDGVIPAADISQQKTKSVMIKGKATPGVKSMLGAKSVASDRSADVAAVKPKVKAASPDANAASVARPEKIARAKEPQTSPVQLPAQAALAIDQQTFEAFKNRAPSFLAAEEMEAAASNPSPEPVAIPR